MMTDHPAEGMLRELTDAEVEAMARAHYADYMGGVEDLEPTWDQLPGAHRERMRSAMRAALSLLPASSPTAKGEEGWVLAPREQLERFTALHYVDERLRLAYSGKGRAEGRPEVIDEIWAIIHNLAEAATELAAPSPPADEAKP